MSENLKHGLSSEVRKKAAHVPAADGDTAFRRGEAGSCDVEEDGGTAAAFSHADVPVHHHADVIKLILPLQPLMTWRERCANGPVVVGVRACVTPQHVTARRAKRQQAWRSDQAVCSSVCVKERHGGDRCRTIPFALAARSAASSECCRNGEMACLQYGASLPELCRYPWRVADRGVLRERECVTKSFEPAGKLSVSWSRLFALFVIIVVLSALKLLQQRLTCRARGQQGLRRWTILEG